MTTSTVKRVLLGTAGHIDHGKTSLVAKLSGIDTDRLPEEKARGISIDLGFAHWESDGIRFGIVDVPGHERFVRNMVAGATGVNIGLLVIAADDGVMPQTREHLEIMDLLGIPTGVIAITKTDLVEPDFVELVEAEIEELTAGTFLEGCPIVSVSSQTGAGIDKLRTVLTDLAGTLEFSRKSDWFRMPIDRVFSIAGHGTVVTGSVLGGEVKAGDIVELLPDGRELRVRSVQVHGSIADDSEANQRTAINLAGIKTDELRRGQELATPGYLHPSRRLLVELRCLSASPVVLKDRLEVSLHIGTSETHVRVVTKGQIIKPGEQGFVELRLLDPVVAAWGQRFILRRISPAITVAGGRILDPGIPSGRRLRSIHESAGEMAADEPIDRLSCLVAAQEPVCEPTAAAWRGGIDPREFDELIERLRADGRVQSVGSIEIVHADRLTSLSRSIMRMIREELDRLQPRRSLPTQKIMVLCRPLADSALLTETIHQLVKSKDLVKVGANLVPADAQVALTKRQRKALDEMLRAIDDAGLSPPTTKELSQQIDQKPDQVANLLNVCVEDGVLVRVSKDLFFTPAALDAGRQTCAQVLKESDAGATMAELRDAMHVTRKFAVPLCEFFDKVGVTRRDGDTRSPGPHIDSPIE
jgi:selenocysteine-specific elongation factor